MMTKKIYVQPEIAVYEVMGCAILAGSGDVQSGNTEGLTKDEDFEF